MTTETSTAVELFKQAVANGLTLTDVLTVYGMTQSPTQQQFSELAQNELGRDGLEFDTNAFASLSTQGAYVLAWKWVPASAVELKVPDFKTLEALEALPFWLDNGDGHVTMDDGYAVSADGQTLTVTADGETHTLNLADATIQVFGATSDEADSVHDVLPDFDGLSDTVIQITVGCSVYNFIWTTS